MIQFSIARNDLLKPLQLVAGVVEKKQTMPVLANVLLVLEGDRLSLTGTDKEIEIVAHIKLSEPAQNGEVTVPARKFLDIVRSLPESAQIKLTAAEDKVELKTSRSRFSLSTLPASDYPSVGQVQGRCEFNMEVPALKRLLDRTAFAMAHQDVRYYLNGMLWELDAAHFRTVATDGHRLAMATFSMEAGVDHRTQVILPRKAVQELSRLLSDEKEGSVSVVIGDKQAVIATQSIAFTSNLIEGKFPDYINVIPKGVKHQVTGNRAALKEAFSRAAILSNDKYRGVRLQFNDNVLIVTANNPEQDEAEEQAEVNYSGEALDVGFNVNYLVDVINVLQGEEVQLSFVNADSSVLVDEITGSEVAYVIMPMRL